MSAEPTPVIRVMLVDDHPLVRMAIRQTLSVPDIDVVGEAASAEEALILAQELRPNVVLVDINLPGMSGVDLVRELAPRMPDARLIMLTVSTDDDDVAAAIDNGASGFLTKEVRPEVLVAAVRDAYRGDLVMPPQMAARLVQNLRVRARRASVPPGPSGFGISRREMEILRLVADGYTDHEIAQALTLSPRTVEAHVASILRKLNVANRREAARLYRAST